MVLFYYIIKRLKHMYSVPVTNKTYSFKEVENDFRREWTISLMCYKNNLNYYIECIWDNTDIGDLIFHTQTIYANIESKMDAFDKIIKNAIKDHITQSHQTTKFEMCSLIKCLEDKLSRD